ncbi:hypothetical protein HJC23_001912 [Cyclotella cryptica]|uniref:Uncharacterized protein n=1 Tax=Cyclotella cryptica TaxID=29204 RepID=A0ABD3P241_9STRA|eukprot:CCRYP_018039-RA/>CCRYP_018039-RA protein AED:0.00 eAED:0.00 QI:1006/-1/1/1/-1/1/1/254/546
MKPKSQRPANSSKSQSTPPKPGKTNTANQTNAKNTKAKRGGVKKNISDGNLTSAAADDTNNEQSSTKLTNNTSGTGKKKRNKKRDSQNGDEADGEIKKTPQLKEEKKFNSEKQNANVYAWSAFQSSPDPSALPDIGGLFLGSGNNEAKAGDEGAASKEGVDLGSSINLDSSLTFGPPSDQIRTSLVNSVLAKNDTGVNAGEALLKSLTSPNRQSSPSAPMPPLHEQFRTAESLEAEMLSPSLKPAEKPTVDQSSLPKFNLMHATPVTSTINAGQSDIEKGLDEAKSDDAGPDAELTIGETLMPANSMSPNPAEQHELPSIKKEYPDAISQLMDPGGFGGVGYGMPNPALQQYPTHHFPLHYGPPPPAYQGQYGPPYPMPPPQPHLQHPYHPMPPHVRPGYTTIQVRVPRALLPGNTMIVDGMQIPVPPGIPPGAVIPVNIPIPMNHQYNHQHYYGPPPHPPPLYHGGYHHHNVPPHAPGQHPITHQIPPPPPQQHSQGQESNMPPQPSSWAARVAGGSPSQSGTADPNYSTKNGETARNSELEPSS